MSNQKATTRSRDALLRRLRDAPPAHLRALHERGNQGVPGLLTDLLGVLEYHLAREPERVALEAFSERLWMFLGTPEDASGAGEADRELLLALTWWLMSEERGPTAEVTTWTGGERGGRREVDGDLVVDGDLELVGAQLFVSGSVHVRGSLICERASTLVTGGGVHAGHAIVARGQAAVFVGGRAEVPLATIASAGNRSLWMGGVHAVVHAMELSPNWSRGMSVAPRVRVRLMEGRGGPVDLDAQLRSVLHPDMLQACPATHGASLDLESPRFWDEIWPMLFTSYRKLDQLLAAGALEVFRNRRQAVWAAHQQGTVRL